MNHQSPISHSCFLLGELEKKVMDVLWASPSALCPHEVQLRLSQPYAYTTVLTILRRLFDKKILLRRRRSSTYCYQPVQTQTVFITGCMDRLFDYLYQCYGQLFVDRFTQKITDFNSKPHQLLTSCRSNYKHRQN